MSSGLSRYKNPKSVIKKRNDYNALHYRSFHLRLSYDKDKEMIEELENGESYTKVVRRWYKESR